MYRLENSRVGSIIKSIASQDLLASSVGINLRRYKILTFVVGSTFAALAGVFLGHYLGALVPSQFGWAYMLFIFIYVVVGGRGAFLGPIAGVIILTVVNEGLRDLRQYVPLVYGAILIMMLLVMPKGLVSLPEVASSAVNRLWKRRKGG